MKKEDLESYKSKKEEILELRYKLEHVTENDAGVGVSVINDYRSGFPHPQAVVGCDYSIIRRRKENYSNRIAKLTAECAAVEDFVEAIEDSVTRRILRMYYIDGLTQKEIGRRVHLDRSSISVKINNFFKTLQEQNNLRNI